MGIIFHGHDINFFKYQGSFCVRGCIRDTLLLKYHEMKYLSQYFVSDMFRIEAIVLILGEQRSHRKSIIDRHLSSGNLI